MPALKARGGVKPKKSANEPAARIKKTKKRSIEGSKGVAAPVVTKKSPKAIKKKQQPQVESLTDDVIAKFNAESAFEGVAEKPAEKQNIDSTGDKSAKKSTNKFKANGVADKKRFKPKNDIEPLRVKTAAKQSKKPAVQPIKPSPASLDSSASPLNSTKPVKGKKRAAGTVETTKKRRVVPPKKRRAVDSESDDVDDDDDEDEENEMPKKNAKKPVRFAKPTIEDDDEDDDEENDDENDDDTNAEKKQATASLRAKEKEASNKRATENTPMSECDPDIVAENNQRHLDRDNRTIFVALPGNAKRVSDSQLKALHPDILNITRLRQSAFLVFHNEEERDKAFAALKDKRPHVKGRQVKLDICGTKGTRQRQPLEADKNLINLKQIVVSDVADDITQQSLQLVFPKAAEIFLYRRKQTAFINFEKLADAKDAFDKGKNLKLASIPVMVRYRTFRKHHLAAEYYEVEFSALKEGAKQQQEAEDLVDSS